jgi:hypothetical protein
LPPRYLPPPPGRVLRPSHWPTFRWFRFPAHQLSEG